MPECGADEPRVVRVESSSAPCVAWLPPVPADSPVVLLGHGGSGSKTTGRNRRLACALTGAGVTAIAIDGPYHGERVRSPLSAVEYQSLMVKRGAAAVIEAMTRDWLSALDAIAEGSCVDIGRVGYIGLSMGSRFGIPLAARLGSRLKVAVFGKFGLQEQPGAFPGLATPELHRRTASQILAPTLFRLQWDDEVFPRGGSLALFESLGSPDKSLLARPGAHGGTHVDDEPSWTRFLLQHLEESGSV